VVGVISRRVSCSHPLHVHAQMEAVGGEAVPMAVVGVTRTPLLDNDRARVMRVRVEPGVSIPAHALCNDALMIPLRSLEVDFVLGETRMRHLERGVAIYIPGSGTV
jgi:hypothetical protein